MTVGEAVELGGRALGVSAHVLKVQPVTDIEDLRRSPLGGNAIDAIAGRAPDAVLDGFAGGVIGVDIARVGQVQWLGARLQDAGDRVLVVEHDGAEVTIDAVVKVKHVAHNAQLLVFNAATSNDVAGNGEGGADIVTTRFADDTDRWWKVVIQGNGQDGCHVVKGLGNEATANVQRLEIIPESSSLVEDKACVTNGLEEGVGIGGTGTNMEGNTYDVQVQLSCQSQKLTSRVKTGAKLQAQTAEGGRVVGQDAQEEFGIGEELFDLVQLIRVVKRHLLDSLFGGVANVGLGLARLSVDDARGINTQAQDHLDLGLGSAVKASAELSEETQNLRVWVAFDGWEVMSAISMKACKTGTGHDLP